MILRFKVWRIRRRAKIVSRHSNRYIHSYVIEGGGKIYVGVFKNGKEVK